MLKFRDIQMASAGAKVVLAILTACAVVIITWMISRTVFRKTALTLAEISVPDPKLGTISRLTYHVSKLDQVQRLSIFDPDATDSLETFHSRAAAQILDSLALICAGDSLQSSRIRRMKEVVVRRELLFSNYRRFRQGLARDGSITRKLKPVSSLVAAGVRNSDTTVLRTYTWSSRKTTIIQDTVRAEQKPVRRSLLQRLFSKDPPPAQLTPAASRVVEDMQFFADTLTVARSAAFISAMDSAIKSLDADRSERRAGVSIHEQRLAKAGNELVEELNQLLRQVQEELIVELGRNTGKLNSVFSVALANLTYVVAAFLVLIFLLLFMIFRDIARSNRRRRELEEAKERAEQLQMAANRFLSNMSHEIRTPLQAILGFTEQLKHKPALQGSHELDAVHRSSEHLLQVVNEVLDYNRIVSDSFVLENRPFSMEDLLATVADIMEGEAERKGLKFRFTARMPAGGWFTGDAFRLKQVLFNLLGNAVKFTNSGEVGLRIDTREVDKDTTAFTFMVTDTGIGISLADQERIFNTFEQAEVAISRRFGGSGLGLAIARTLVKLQGGNITVDSGPGKGSVFSFSLSFRRAGSRVNTARGQYAADPGRRSVAAVDDDEFVLKLYQTVFDRYSIDHVCFSDAQHALESVARQSFDVVLIDIRMPALNGMELAAGLRQKCGPGLRLVAVTAQALPGEIAQLKSKPFDGLLLKPFTEADLLAAIGAHRPQPVLAGEQPDLASLKLLSGNDEKLFNENMEVLRAQLIADIALFKKGLAGNNGLLVAEAAHRLSSKCGQVGLHRIAFSFRELESNARKNELPVSSAENLLDELAGVFPLLKTADGQPSMP